ncbi:MgtC/SapB family protein [Tabrizicola sp.]|uniref:MgtC/SapB family protein n=1 Tax=Tabrizicola sp. TaxID=2005166 RepID=UPI0035AEA2DA
MTPQSLIATLEDQSLMVPLAFSLAAGLLIGIERELRRKPAGLRTHALVCVASALMTLLGLRMEDWAAVLPDGTQIVSDMARMPHAILTGIGFLGAGVIFREGPSVQGLTTAATLWMTAALGIVFGAGLLELGVIGTVAALLVLILFRLVQRVMPPKPVIRLDVVVPATSTLDGTQLTAALAGIGLTAGPISLAQDIGLGLRRYKLMAAGQDQRIDCDAVASALRSTADLQKLTVVPLDRDTGT